MPANVIAAAENAVERISLTEAESEKAKKNKVVYELEGVVDGGDDEDGHRDEDHD